MTSPLTGVQRTLAAGYTEKELLVSGVADTYTGPAVGPAKLDHRSIPYTTRILLRYPTDPSRFSGRVLLEPFNTSSGPDLDASWGLLHTSLQKDGDAWIGVTVRAPAVAALKKLDPARYSALNLPVNDIEWDILRQVGGLIKQSDASGPLKGLRVKRLYMAGYSQSGIDVATFAMAFTPLTRMSDGSSVYDGYLPESHSGSLTPLKSGTAVLVKFESRPMVPVAVPVVDTETQTDIEGFTAPINPTLSYTSPGSARVRRADANTATDRYRLWEIPGAPHAPKIPGCVGSSDFPVDAFARAAYEALTRWAEEGIVPPTAARIETANIGVVSASRLDATGNALGGVRSPYLDVPLARYQAHSTPGAFCELAGQMTFLPVATLRSRYGPPADYMARFDTDLDKTITAGFLLDSDRASLIDQQEQDARRAFK